MNYSGSVVLDCKTFELWKSDKCHNTHKNQQCVTEMEEGHKEAIMMFLLVLA